MSEKPDEILANIVNLCESDPDAGLQLIELSTKGNTEAESNPFWNWARAMAYLGKGFLRTLREHGLSDEEFDDMPNWGIGEFREKFGLSEQQLDYLEAALREIRRIETIAPDFVAMIGTEDEPMGEARVDLIAGVLGKCRPGRVQELMGATKLHYFGSAHRRMGVRPGLDLTSEDYRILWHTKFRASSIAKSAIAMDKGMDGKGRRFVTCLLYQNCADEWEDEETLGSAPSAGALYLFDDGSWHHSNDIKAVFLGAVMPGWSLPPEFKKHPEAKTEGH